MKKINRKLVMLISAILIAVVVGSIAIYAAITKTSTRGDAIISSQEITATTEFTSSTSSLDFTFTKAGEKKTAQIKTLNSSPSVLHSVYKIALKGDSNDEILYSAILVYYNDEYKGTLKELTYPKSSDIESEDTFIPLSASKTDELTFELHQAAEDSIFDGKSVSLELSCYTENADYSKYTFVTSEAEFSKALDDMNSGLLDNDPVIVLCNNVALTKSYTLTQKATIALNGNTLSSTGSGALVLNSEDALLEVVGNGTLSSTVTLTKFDEANAKKLLAATITANLKDGVASGGSISPLGNYSFYASKITVSGLASNSGTYSSGTYKAPTTTITIVEGLSFGGEIAEFEVIGSEVALATATLKHIPNNPDTEVTTDLFLPTSLKDENSTITWESSNPSIMDRQGKIVISYCNQEKVNLYATINVNGTTYRRVFSFVVSVHNDEINFYKFVAEISPIPLDRIYNGTNDSEALYYLPIYTSNLGQYDYRTNYNTPSDTEFFKWYAYKDIGLTGITYSMTEYQEDNFDYITLSGNSLCLNKNTLSSYAQITITGTYADKTYTSDINISISVGNNTQLMEQAFGEVSKSFDDIDILYNILSTRKANGYYAAKGDFSVIAGFKDDNENVYTFTYAPAPGFESVIGTIAKDPDDDTKYIIPINPEGFDSMISTVAIVATVHYGDITDSRTYYFDVPAALHIDDLDNISVFNSLQYQTFNQLPAAERTGATGFTAGTTLSNKNYDYILLRDIVGDEAYISDYCSDKDYALDYLKKLGYVDSDATEFVVASGKTAYIANGVYNLYFYTPTSNNSSATDNAAYDFMRLIQWATSSTRVTASSVVTNTGALGTLGSTSSNGESYLTDDEVKVLKQFYTYYTSASDWDTIYSQSFERAPGYIYTDSTLLNQVIKCMADERGSSSSVYYNGAEKVPFSTIYGKYVEIVNRYATSTNSKEQAMAPCQEVYNTRYGWYISDQSVSSGTVRYIKNATNVGSNITSWTNLDFTSSTHIQTKSGKYWNKFESGLTTTSTGRHIGLYSQPDYDSDLTAYITENELIILRVFWLNAIRDFQTTSYSTTNLNTISGLLTNYPGYTSSDFDNYSKAILNAFEACMTVPSYFTTDGVSKLLSSFYENYHSGTTKYTLNKYSTAAEEVFVSQLKTPTVSSDLTSISHKAIASYAVPMVYGLDHLENSLAYFKNLENLYIYGNSSLYAFHGENTLSSVITKTLNSHSSLETLVTEYCATTAMTYDLSILKNSDSLKYLDLSHNPGIVSTNELVNTNRGNYEFVDISNIGLEDEYVEFAVDNIATSDCIVYWKNSRVGTRASGASALAELSDFDRFVTMYFYMANNIQNEDGTTSTVTWRIEEGNEITRITNGVYINQFASQREMLEYVSPYYYCKEDCSYTFNGQEFVFSKGYVYKLEYINSSLVIDAVMKCSSVTTLDSSLVSQAAPTYSTYTPTTTVTSSNEITVEGTSTEMSRVTSYTDETSYNNYTGAGVQLKPVYLRGSSSQSNYLNMDENFVSNNPNNYNQTKFFILTPEEVVKIENNLYNSSVTVGLTNSKGTSKINYHICSLINNQFYYLVISTSGLSVTSDRSEASIFILDSSGRFKSGTLYLAYKNSKWIAQTGATSTYWTTVDQVYYSSYDFKAGFIATFTDGSMEAHNALTMGYKVMKYTGQTRRYYETETTKYDTKTGTTYKYYYYTGDDATYAGVNVLKNDVVRLGCLYEYPVVERTRYRDATEEVYVIEIWYKGSSSGAEETVKGSLKSFTYYTSSSSGTTVDLTKVSKGGTDSSVYGEWSDSWSTPLTSTWVFKDIVVNRYISYVDELVGPTNETNKLMTQVESINRINDGETWYLKSAATNAATLVHNESISGVSTTFTNSFAYYMTISGGVLTWNRNSTNIGNNSGDNTSNMDLILEEANKHFGDEQYGYYYGRLYGFDATTRLGASGVNYTQYTIYRLMPNARNTAFEYVVWGTFKKDTSSNILRDLGTNVVGEGDIFYSTANAFGYYQPNYFYKIVLDGVTNTLNLVKFNDVGITVGNVTKLTNDKIHAISAGDYLGYSGAFTCEISAVLRTRNSDGSYTEIVKKYKMKLIGSLYA